MLWAKITRRRAAHARRSLLRRSRPEELRLARRSDSISGAVTRVALSPDPKEHHPTYFTLLKDMLTVDPSSWAVIEGINNFILEGDLYKALKEAKKLIAHEKELLDIAASELARKSA
mgnify:CR=1 FL=1